MDQRYRVVETLEDKAEGRCLGLPYNTELVNIDGVVIHFWCGEIIDDALLQRAIAIARAERDIVAITCSLGEPEGFWANNNLPSPRDR